MTQQLKRSPPLSIFMDHPVPLRSEIGEAVSTTIVINSSSLLDFEVEVPFALGSSADRENLRKLLIYLYATKKVSRFDNIATIHKNNCLYFNSGDSTQNKVYSETQHSVLFGEIHFTPEGFECPKVERPKKKQLVRKQSCKTM